MFRKDRGSEQLYQPLNQIGIYKTLYPTTERHTFFAAAHIHQERP